MAEMKTLFNRLMPMNFIFVALCFTAICSSVGPCPLGQYWSSVLGECRPCWEVCMPPTRLPCSDFCPDYLENLKTATTSTTKTMTTTSQPVTTDSTRSKNHLLLAVIGSVALLPAFFALFIYIPKATSRIGLHQDAESGNSQESIELQSLTNTAEPESNGTPAMDRNGDDNRQDNAAETLHLAAIYESKNNCIRIHGVESLPAQRAIRIDGVESLPAQRAQLPDSTEQNHSHP